MTNLPQLADTLHRLLGDTADQLARASGFIKRQRTLTGSAFVQALVFGWLGDPDASLATLAQSTAAAGRPITPQSLDVRFTPEATMLLEGVLARAAGALIEGDAITEGLLSRFEGVYLLDTSIVSLPAEMAQRWPGMGGNTPTAGRAAIKIEARLDLTDGALCAHVMSARSHDQRGLLVAAPLPEGSLSVADLGYFSVERFRQIGDERRFWLSRLKAGTVLYDADGARIDLLAMLRQASPTVDLPVWMGAEHRLACRLVARAVSPEVAAERQRRLRRSMAKKGRVPTEDRLALCRWTLLVTNVPAERLSADGVRALYRARWQIELVFKLWKQHGGLARSRSRNPWRVLCEVYAKLLAGVVASWVTAVGAWCRANRSLVKVWQAVSAHARHLLVSLWSVAALEDALAVVMWVVGSAGCRLNPRRGRPSTCQQLTAPEVCALT